MGTRYKAVVIGGSAGSFQVVVRILQSLPNSFSLPLILCLHRLKHVRTGFEEALSLRSAMLSSLLIRKIFVLEWHI